MKVLRYCIVSLLLTFTAIGQAYSAADMGNTSVISPVDASNATGTCPSWSGSAAPSTLDDSGRCIQGAVAREWENRSFVLTSAGSSTAYTLTFTTAPAAYRTGQVFSFIVDETNGASATVNVNTLGAVTVKKLVAGTLTDLEAGDWAANDRVSVAYNATGPVLVWVNQGFVTGVPSASTTVEGVSELATDAEAVTGTDTVRNITPANLLAVRLINVQTMTATGAGDSWDKPTGGQQLCKIEVWGAGGSGGKGRATSAGGGGGGGQYIERTIAMSSLSATEAVSIGTGGAAQTVADTSGNIGGDSSFGTGGTLVAAYGGGAGAGANTTGLNGGGNGGGPVGAGLPGGVAGSTAREDTRNEGLGGAPGATASGIGVAVLPGAGFSTYANGAGGGGSSGEATLTWGVGGNSVYGGGGGGSGGEDSSPGGLAGGTSQFGGAGGAGAFDANAATAGTQPAGGGGGSETGTSGAGGNGKAIITCW